MAHDLTTGPCQLPNNTFLRERKKITLDILGLIWASNYKKLFTCSCCTMFVNPLLHGGIDLIDQFTLFKRKDSLTCIVCFTHCSALKGVTQKSQQILHYYLRGHFFGLIAHWEFEKFSNKYVKYISTNNSHMVISSFKTQSSKWETCETKTCL